MWFIYTCIYSVNAVQQDFYRHLKMWSQFEPSISTFSIIYCWVELRLYISYLFDPYLHLQLLPPAFCRCRSFTAKTNEG